MIVGTLRITDRFVLQEPTPGRWVRVTRITNYVLRATKGYLKDGPVRTFSERELKKPKEWRTERLREFTRLR